MSQPQAIQMALYESMNDDDNRHQLTYNNHSNSNHPVTSVTQKRARDNDIDSNIKRIEEESFTSDIQHHTKQQRCIYSNEENNVNNTLITHGAIKELRVYPVKQQNTTEPVLQVISVKKLDNCRSYKVVVGDDNDTINCIFGHTATYDIDNNILRSGSVLKLKHFILNERMQAK